MTPELIFTNQMVAEYLSPHCTWKNKQIQKCLICFIRFVNNSQVSSHPAHLKKSCPKLPEKKPGKWLMEHLMIAQHSDKVVPMC